MSDLYQIKILSRKDLFISPYELCELYDYNPFRNMKPFLDEMRIVTKNEGRVISLKRFAEILKEKEVTETRLFYTNRMSPYYCKEVMMNIRDNYPKENSERYNFMSFIWYQMLSEVFPEKYPPYNTTEIIAEVVSIHPDAGFPKAKYYDKIFVLRFLVDTLRHTPNRITEYYNSTGGLDKRSMRDDDIIWIYQELDKFVIKPNSKDFWKEHEGGWWADEFSDHGGSIGHQYELRKIRLILPAGWYPELSGESKVFDSAAFW